MALHSRHSDRYLVAALRLSLAAEKISVGRLAAALGVTGSSASAMTGRLVDAGLLQRSGRGLVLTIEGRRQGTRLLRRHRIVECLLADVLGMPMDRVHEEASRLEEAFSDGVLARLSEKLGDPTVCPHGRTIPDGRVDVARPLLLTVPASSELSAISCDSGDGERGSEAGSVPLSGTDGADRSEDEP